MNFFAFLRTEETIRDAMRWGAELTSCALKTYGRRKKRSSAMEQVYRSLPSGKAAFYRSEEEGLCACHVLSVSSLETWEPLQVLSCPTPFEAALSKPVASLGSSDSAASYILCTFFLNYYYFYRRPRFIVAIYWRREESKTFQRQRHRHGWMFDTQ